MTFRNLATVAVLLTLGNSTSASAQSIGEQVTPPATGTFFSMQNTNWPPLPWCPYDVPVYFLGTNELGYLGYAYDDREITYSSGGNHSQNSVDPPPGPGGDEGNGEDPGVPPLPYGPYGSNDLWLEIFAPSNNLAPLALHGTRPGFYYQIDRRNQVNNTNWVFGQVIQNDTGTNRLFFDPVAVLAAPKRFFRGVEGYPVVSVNVGGSDAMEPSGTNFAGVVQAFTISVSDVLSSNLVVKYVMSGSAQNGVDYTNLSGSVTISSGQGQVFLYVQPIEDSLIEFTETAKLTLVRTNGYLVDPDAAAQTIPLSDWYPTNLFTVVATNLDSPSGIDYHPTTNALIVSIGWPSGEPNNFVRIAANGGVTNWSGIHGLTEEIKLAIVKTNAGGFTAGDMYFGTGVNGQVAKLSADGTVSNLSWAILTTNTATFETLLRGGLHFDQTGVFSNNLIVVTGGTSEEGGGVWRLSSTASAVQLANITNADQPHLEGVVTLTNDVQRWGPWAGKIVTGAESKMPPLVHTVDTNGVVDSFELGIEPEDFDVVLPNQDLYCCVKQQGWIIKLSKALLTNYWGDLVITQEGAASSSPPRLFIAHWNSTNSVFVNRYITFNHEFEHVTFAPITLPNIPIPAE